MNTSLTQCEVAVLRESASQACALLKALASGRLLLLCQLVGHGNVGELEALTGIRQPPCRNSWACCATRAWWRRAETANTSTGGREMVGVGVGLQQPVGPQAMLAHVLDHAVGAGGAGAAGLGS